MGTSNRLIADKDTPDKAPNVGAFVRSKDGTLITSTTVNSDEGLDVNVLNQISVTPSGLNVAGKVTEVTLSSASWTDLPATALADRNAISIQNPSGNPTIKVNFATPAGFVGMIIAPGGERFYDITDSITIRAKAASGTPTINVEELS